MQRIEEGSYFNLSTEHRATLLREIDMLWVGARQIFEDMPRKKKKKWKKRFEALILTHHYKYIIKNGEKVKDVIKT